LPFALGKERDATTVRERESKVREGERVTSFSSGREGRGFFLSKRKNTHYLIVGGVKKKEEGRTLLSEGGGGKVGETAISCTFWTKKKKRNPDQ